MVRNVVERVAGAGGVYRSVAPLGMQGAAPPHFKKQILLGIVYYVPRGTIRVVARQCSQEIEAKA